jgi:hypothetical protein
MPSPVITGSQRQLTLEFDESLASAHRNLRDCIAAGIYKRGLKRVAPDLGLAPGNLSAALSDESPRKFCVDELELYLQTTGDMTPIHYLIARYLGDQLAARDQAMGQVLELLKALPQLAAAAGLPTAAKRR